MEKPECVPAEEWEKGLRYLAKMMASEHSGEIRTWSFRELGDVPAPFDDIGSSESSYRRGYMQGYWQAGVDCGELYRKGFIRGSEVSNIITNFAETVLAFWRWRKVANEMIPPDELQHESWDEIRRRIIRRDCGKCVKCGDVIKLEVDHINPVSDGGIPVDGNLRTLCVGCHRKRKVKK